MTKIRHLSYETCQLLPFFSTFVATMLCGVLLTLDLIQSSGDVEPIKICYEIIVVSVGFILIFLFSWILRYCWFQLIGIIYTYAFMLCLWICRYTEGHNGIFGRHIIEAHALMLIMGVIYCYAVIRGIKKPHEEESEKKI